MTPGGGNTPFEVVTSQGPRHGMTTWAKVATTIPCQPGGLLQSWQDAPGDVFVR